MRSKWEMSCPLPETPVSLNTPFSEPGASVYGFMVIANIYPQKERTESVGNNGDSYWVTILELKIISLLTILRVCINYIVQISISNDGSLFSPPVELTVYDSVCQSCESAANCVRQVGGLINRFSLLPKA